MIGQPGALWHYATQVVLFPSNFFVPLSITIIPERLPDARYDSTEKT